MSATGGGAGGGARSGITVTLERGDADGVVVVRRDEVEEVIRLSQARDDAERDLIRRYHEGGTTIELCNLTEVLKAKGLLVEDAG